MSAYISYLNSLMNITKLKYSNFPQIKWLNTYSADEFKDLRDSLISSFSSSTKFKGTKPYYKQLSPGCELCGQGLWSCLFITGNCNAKCFYCPAKQDQDDIPFSQGMTFPTPESYAEYVSYFKFKGVGFSGGEPLLVFDKLIAYIEHLRRTNTPDLYIWMYTNGILSNKEHFHKLADLGLDEVRFDIGATNYSLDKIKNAKGIINNISIEIPAIPEEKERIKALLPQMIKSGVSNLNLHQLRLTEYNAPNLLKRNYTYIAAERPIVLESEMAALEIMDYAKNLNLEIGINYCSFFFKNRFQSAGFKRNIAKMFTITEGDITEKGYIRGLSNTCAEYSSIKLSDSSGMDSGIKSFDLTHKKYSFLKHLIYTQNIDNDHFRNAIATIIANQSLLIPEIQNLYNIWEYETIENGLRDI